MKKFPTTRVVFQTREPNETGLYVEPFRWVKGLYVPHGRGSTEERAWDKLQTAVGATQGIHLSVHRPVDLQVPRAFGRGTKTVPGVRFLVGKAVLHEPTAELPGEEDHLNAFYDLGAIVTKAAALLGASVETSQDLTERLHQELAADNHHTSIVLGPNLDYLLNIGFMEP